LNNLEDLQSYTYYVICENEAKLRSEVKQVDFSVDLSKGAAIRILSPERRYSSNLTHDIIVQTNKRAIDTCKWGFAADAAHRDFDLSEDDHHRHIVEDFTFAAGEHTIYVECLIEGQIKKAEKTFTFDTTPPVFENIDDGIFSWRLDQLTATFDFVDNESGIDNYEYAIGRRSVNGVNAPEEWQSEATPEFTSSRTITVKGLNLTNLANYYWAVRARNRAGLLSQWYSSDGVTVDLSKRPSLGMCTNGFKDQGETDIDCGGDTECTRCGDGKTCVDDADCIGSCENNICVSDICSNGIQDNGETDVDCGGDICVGCDIGKACTENLDCAQRFCNNNTCDVPACDDTILNGWETDVDCGGDNQCNRCGPGDACLVDADCASSLCGEDKTCLPSSCTDTLLNGDETDIDCGGSCDACDDGQFCSVDSDCSSDYCLDGRCADRDLKDSDGDGMADWWEIQYNLDPFNPSDASMEALAGDGMTNFEKYDYRNSEYNKQGIPLDPTEDDYDQDGHKDVKEIKKAKDAVDPLSYPEAKWWSILLFILALIIIGGALGYFGYSRYTTKQQETVQVRLPPPMQQGPVRITASPKKRRLTLKEKLKLALKNKVRDARREALSKEHLSITSGFSDKDNKAKTGPVDVDGLKGKIQSLKEKVASSSLAKESAPADTTKDDIDASAPVSALERLKKMKGGAEEKKSKGTAGLDTLRSLNDGRSGKKKDGAEHAIDKLSDIIETTHKDVEGKQEKTEGQKHIISHLSKDAKDDAEGESGAKQKKE
jgi:hypothetical protein